jgi:hypothetical protein
MITSGITQANTGNMGTCVSTMDSSWSGGIWSARPESSICARMYARASIFCSQTAVNARFRIRKAASGSQKRGRTSSAWKASRGAK